MNHLLVCFFAVLTVASATNSPLDNVVNLYKNGAVPTMALLDTKFEETVSIITQALVGVTLLIPDFTKSYLDGNGETVTIQLTDGQITGFETKFYVDEATVQTISKTHVLVTSRFGNEKLIANYNYESEKNGVVTQGTVVAEIEEFVYEVDIRLDLQTFLLEFLIHRILNEGEMVIEVDGQTNADVANAIVGNIKNIAAALAKQLATDLVNDYNSNM